MQSIGEYGKQYFSVDIRLLEGYVYGDPVTFKLSKSGCTSRLFNASVSEPVCENNVLFEIDINQCLDQIGYWNIEIRNSENEIIYSNLVQVHKNLL